ncbi:MAG: hypothetical protein K1X88_05670 [Nannocystaceae bacterium]|nr:hypothetical protein [Nannocystaceae bacterium]
MIAHASWRQGAALGMLLAIACDELPDVDSLCPQLGCVDFGLTIDVALAEQAAPGTYRLEIETDVATYVARCSVTGSPSCEPDGDDGADIDGGLEMMTVERLDDAETTGTTLRIIVSRIVDRSTSEHPFIDEGGPSELHLTITRGDAQLFSDRVVGGDEHTREDRCTRCANSYAQVEVPETPRRGD